MKVLFNLCSAVEALYSTAAPEYIEANIAALQYSFLDLQLGWYETIDVPSQDPVVFQTVSLITQTLISSNATFAVNSPNFYDAISMSFIKQAHRNSLYFDNYSCEWIPGIENIGSRVEATVSGGSQPIRFPIQTYSELALNYHKSLAGDVKNSVMNTYTSQNGCWGIGYEQNPSSHPSDCFIYVSGLISV
jgi:hypothetical protein